MSGHRHGKSDAEWKILRSALPRRRQTRKGCMTEG